MRVRIVHSIVFFVLIAAMPGCKAIFKTRWSNFNAYYNTFYNAELYYAKGVQKITTRTEPVNPEQPIRIHPKPPTAVDQDLENAILKGADILRDHSDSKWVDDALLLIGKSYYYQGNFFSADQKFQEVLSSTTNQDLIQEAVKWRGLFFLDTEQYEQGVDYLNTQLANEDIRWKDASKAEIQLVLAQLFSAQELWELTEDQLKLALPEAKGKTLLANGWFLLGQVRERSGQEDAALQAYARVARYNPEYSLVYHARRKQAEISRETGLLNQALRIFSDMSRDDKNFDLVSELNYDIARTYQLMGEIDRAEAMYYDVLQYTIKTPSAETKAKSYYGLAEIYRDHYNDFFLAASYFDSAASTGNDITKLPSWFDAAELSTTFGSYRTLSQEAYEADSLLWLSNLNQEAFDSVLAIVSAQKLAQLREEQRRQQAAANTMLNVGGARPQQTMGSQASNGFLNHKNQTMVNQSKESFKAIWGDRPLVDNWRRQDAVRLAREDPDLKVEDQTLGNTQNSQELEVSIDLSKIPFSPEEKEKSRALIANRIYEIGNLFFLQMELPDSAEFNYRKVINRYSDLPVAMQAMFSLSELYYSEGDTTGALIWADRLATEYPETMYRNRLADRFPDRFTPLEMSMTREDSLKQGFSDRIQMVVDSLSVDRIESLRAYSVLEFEDPMAADALLLSAQKYIELGKKEPIYKSNYQPYIDLKAKLDLEEAFFKTMKDSAKVLLADTVAQVDTLYWKPWADTSYLRKDRPELFPYRGAMWDSSRVVLKQWETQFASHPKKDIVSRLSSAIQYPPYVTSWLDSIRIANEPKPVVPIDTSITAVDDSTLQDVQNKILETAQQAEQSTQEVVQAQETQEVQTDTGPRTLPDGRPVYLLKDLDKEFEPLIEMDVFVKSLQLEEAFPNLASDAVFRFKITIDEYGRPLEVEPIEPGSLETEANYIAMFIKEALNFKAIIGPLGVEVVAEGELEIKR
jgi:tetratricopeptide (TPR) repeat protein